MVGSRDADKILYKNARFNIPTTKGTCQPSIHHPSIYRTPFTRTWGQFRVSNWPKFGQFGTVGGYQSLHTPLIRTGVEPWTLRCLCHPDFPPTLTKNVQWNNKAQKGNCQKFFRQYKKFQLFEPHYANRAEKVWSFFSCRSRFSVHIASWQRLGWWWAAGLGMNNGKTVWWAAEEGAVTCDGTNDSGTVGEREGIAIGEALEVWPTWYTPADDKFVFFPFFTGGLVEKKQRDWAKSFLKRETSFCATLSSEREIDREMNRWWNWGKKKHLFVMTGEENRRRQAEVWRRERK